MPEAEGPVDRDHRRATVRAAISALTQAFRDAGLEMPELDARLLVFAASGLSPEAHILHPERPLSPTERSRVSEFEGRRLAREPVSRILGHREFWGRCFEIAPAVLDPRPDSETLIEAALTLLREQPATTPPTILDLGTGSGCLLLTLLAELPGTWGVGADLEAGAIAIARRNAARLGLSSRCGFVKCDWSGTFSGPFGLIVSNPPYIKGADMAELTEEVRLFDPPLALNGGLDGLEAYRKIVTDCARIAAPGSWVLLEAGIGQAEDIVGLFAQAGWSTDARHCRIFDDLAGIHRVVAVMRQTGAR
jgi:release factor glutamine methyltransferase